jgi:hypothetical protein
MPDGGKDFPDRLVSAGRVEVADELFELMPRDAVFALRFLGESRSRLLQHFHALILAELAKLGATPETHPMLSAFAETHALTLRDFVVSGVEIAHQFRIEEIERLSGDSAGVLRVDVWDQLKSYIADAESQFRRQLVGMREQIEAYRVRAADADRTDEGR